MTPELTPYPEFFDRQGKIIDLDTYSRLCRDVEYKVIKRTRVGDVTVITAWLGRDQRDFVEDARRPQIFGTTTRWPASDPGPERDTGWGAEVTAATESEALRNHARAVADAGTS